MGVRRNPTLAIVASVIASVIVAVIVAGVVVKVAARHHEASSKPLIIRDQSSADLHDEVAALRAEVVRLKTLSGATIGALASMQLGAAAHYTNDSSESARTVASAKNTPALGETMLIERTEERFQREPRDSWGRSVEGLARQYLARGAAVDALLRSLDCHSTMCKAVVAYNDSADYESAQRRLLSAPSLDWSGGVIYAQPREQGGRLEMDVYLCRPGEDPIGDIVVEENSRSGLVP